MKIPFTLFIILLNIELNGQDTTFLQQREFSGKVVRVVKGLDTSVVGFYKNGKIESVRCFKNNRITGCYDRYYPNGNKMWTKNMKNDKENGKCLYYNKLGEKVAELNYENGIIRDTIFISSKETVLLGKATWYQVVHGGVDYGDNIPIQQAEEDWPYQNYPFTLVKITDSKTIPKVNQKFETDCYGAFFLCLQKGEYGIFPGAYSLKNLQPGQYCPLPEVSDSGQSGWNMLAPLKIGNASLQYFHLHFLSEGWAP